MLVQQQSSLFSHPSQVSHIDSNKSKGSNKIPPSTSWSCGEWHSARFCPFKKRKCQVCHKRGLRKTSNLLITKLIVSLLTKLIVSLLTKLIKNESAEKITFSVCYFQSRFQIPQGIYQCRFKRNPSSFSIWHSIWYHPYFSEYMDKNWQTWSTKNKTCCLKRIWKWHSIHWWTKLLRFFSRKTIHWNMLYDRSGSKSDWFRLDRRTWYFHRPIEICFQFIFPQVSSGHWKIFYSDA